MLTHAGCVLLSMQAPFFLLPLSPAGPQSHVGGSGAGGSDSRGSGSNSGEPRARRCSVASMSESSDSSVQYEPSYVPRAWWDKVRARVRVRVAAKVVMTTWSFWVTAVHQPYNLKTIQRHLHIPNSSWQLEQRAPTC